MVQRTYAGQSAAQRRATREQQFLAAGLEVFGRDGWAGATVTAICDEAGLSARYFYEVAETREALFIAVTDRIAAGIEEVVTTALDRPDLAPEQRAEHVLAALATHLTSDPRLVRVGLIESLATEAFRVRRRRLVLAFSATAARLMRALRDEPSTPASDQSLQISAALLTGGVIEALVMWATDERLAPTDDVVAHLARLYVAAARL